MEREYGEFATEIENLGISEDEEDKAVENPTISIKQQQKKAKASSKVVQLTPAYQKPQKTVWKAKKQPKKKAVIFVEP